ncbi:MAG: hypothetical protein WCW64_00755 [Phycisphaerae bacterium]|jgi:hypothetical protein
MAKGKKLIRNISAFPAILITSIIFPSLLFLGVYVKGLRERLSISVSHPVSFWLILFFCIFVIMLGLFYLQSRFYNNKWVALALCALALPLFRFALAVIDWLRFGIYNPFTELISAYPTELYLMLVIAFLNITGYYAFSFILKD